MVDKPSAWRGVVVHGGYGTFAKRPRGHFWQIPQGASSSRYVPGGHHFVGVDVGSGEGSDVGAGDGTRDGSADGGRVGNGVGANVGTNVGTGVGTSDGIAVGKGVIVGSGDGAGVGFAELVGTGVGNQSAVGPGEGSSVGEGVGSFVGAREGMGLGPKVGGRVGDDDGASVGEGVGSRVGCDDGNRLGANEGSAVGASEKERKHVSTQKASATEGCGVGAPVGGRVYPTTMEVLETLEPSSVVFTSMVRLLRIVALTLVASSVSALVKLPLDTAVLRSEVNDEASSEIVPLNAVASLLDDNLSRVPSSGISSWNAMFTFDAAVGAGDGANRAKRLRRPVDEEVTPLAVIAVTSDVLERALMIRTRVLLMAVAMVSVKAEG